MRRGAAMTAPKDYSPAGACEDPVLQTSASPGGHPLDVLGYSGKQDRKGEAKPGNRRKALPDSYQRKRSVLFSINRSGGIMKKAAYERGWR